VAVPLDELGMLVLQDFDRTREWSIANREVLRWMPCTCGCVNGGQSSNFDCYVREVCCLTAASGSTR